MKARVPKTEWINKCPDCDSENIGTFRMRNGPIWCEECGFKVEEKEHFNPFFTEVEIDRDKTSKHVPEEVGC